MTKRARPVPRERATCSSGHRPSEPELNRNLQKTRSFRGRDIQIDLTGKTAFVSGSTQGIGRAIAARLAECGATTTINGREQARVDAVLAELRAEQPDARFEGVGADVATAEGAAALFEALPRSTS